MHKDDVDYEESRHDEAEKNKAQYGQAVGQVSTFSVGRNLDEKSDEDLFKMIEMQKSREKNLFNDSEDADGDS